MLSASRPLAVRAALLITLFGAPLYAQDVQYTSVTKVDLGTGLNAMMRLAGAAEVKENTYIKGKKLRSDSDKQSLIFDLDNNRYIILNHAEKTYMSVPLSDMAMVATSGVRGMRADASKGQLKGTAVDSAGNKADFTVDLKTEPTTERRNINGNDAARLFITMVTDVDVTPQGESQAQNAGKLVVLMDVWNANTGPRMTRSAPGSRRRRRSSLPPRSGIARTSDPRSRQTPRWRKRSRRRTRRRRRSMASR
jgi:hypothetical protein